MIYHITCSFRGSCRKMPKISNIKMFKHCNHRRTYWTRGIYTWKLFGAITTQKFLIKLIHFWTDLSIGGSFCVPITIVIVISHYHFLWWGLRGIPPMLMMIHVNGDVVIHNLEIILWCHRSYEACHFASYCCDEG